MGYTFRSLFRSTTLLSFLLITGTTGPVVFGQLPTQSTRILDQIYNTDGTPFRGDILIQPTCLPTNGVLSFSQSPLRYCVAPTGAVNSDCHMKSSVAGQIDLTLLPTGVGSGTQPTSCRYSFRYTGESGRTWVTLVNVPVSSDPVRLSGIQTLQGVAPTNAVMDGRAVSMGYLADGCVRIVSGQFQTFTGPDCTVIQTPPWEQNYAYTFTNTASIVIPGSFHNAQTRDLVFTCTNADGSWLLCGSGGVDPITYEIKMQWSEPRSGVVIIGTKSGSVPNQGFSFASSTTWTVPQSAHGANHNRIMAQCYENTLTAGVFRWFFCAPNVNPTTHDVVFNFGVARAGRAVLMIK